MPIDFFPIFRNAIRWGDISGSIANQNDLQQALNSASSVHICNLDVSNLQEKFKPDSDDLLLLEDSIDFFQQKKVKLSSINNPMIISHNWNIVGDVKVQDGLLDYLNPTFIYVPNGLRVKLLSAMFKLKTGSANAKLLINGDEISGWGDDLNAIEIDSNLQTLESSAIFIESNSMLELVIISTASSAQHLSFSIFMQHERI